MKEDDVGGRVCRAEGLNGKKGVGKKERVWPSLLYYNFKDRTVQYAACMWHRSFKGYCYIT